MTVDAAADLAAVPPVGRLKDLERHRHCTVVTFRADGSGVATPVWFALDGERLVFRSLTPAAKLRRIAHDPTVLVAPCSSLGSPKGPPLRGRADLLAGGAAAAA